MHIKSIFKFSAHMTGFQVVNYFSRNVDYLLIGKFLGAEALGFYTLAYRLMLIPLRNISGVLGKVIFPAFSKIHNDLHRIRNSYVKLVKSISLITFPLMCGLFVITPELTAIFLGSKWQPSVIVIRILCLCGAVQSINTTAGNIILSQGRSDIQLKLGIIGTVFAVLFVSVGLYWGIVGVAISYTICSIFWFVYVEQIVNSLIKLPARRFYLSLGKGAIIGLFVLGMMLIAKQLLPPSLTSFCLYIAIGFGSYILALLWSKELIYFDKNRSLKISL